MKIYKLYQSMDQLDILLWTKDPLSQVLSL